MTPEELAKYRHSATRPRRVVPVLLDGTLRAQLEDLDDAERPAADRRLSSRPADTAKRDQLQEAMADATLHVVVEGLDHTVFRALIGQHPPRKTADGKTLPDDQFAGVEANSETVRIPLIRACAVGSSDDGTLTGKVSEFDEDTMNWFVGFLTDAETEVLTVECLRVNRADAGVPTPRPLSAIRTPAEG